MRNGSDRNLELSDLSVHTKLANEKTVGIISLHWFVIMFISTETCPCSLGWIARGSRELYPCSRSAIETDDVYKTPFQTTRAAVEILTSR
ncbi:hypothetical protein KQX54_000285, partial [Cotesia glomerata]